jgi:hypothetical protein
MLGWLVVQVLPRKHLVSKESMESMEEKEWEKGWEISWEIFYI